MKPAATCRQRGLACQNAETKECVDQCAVQGLTWISRPTPPTPPRPQPLTLLNNKPYSCNQLGLCQNPYRVCEGGLCEIDAARLASVDLLRAHYSDNPPSWHQAAKPDAPAPHNAAPPQATPFDKGPRQSSAGRGHVPPYPFAPANSADRIVPQPAPESPYTAPPRWLRYQFAAAAILGLACGALYGLAQWLGH